MFYLKKKEKIGGKELLAHPVLFIHTTNVCISDARQRQALTLNDLGTPPSSLDRWIRQLRDCELIPFLKKVKNHFEISKAWTT